MATVRGIDLDIRRQLMFAAANRWRDREAHRNEGLQRIEEMGPGAADSPAQVARYNNRENRKAAFNSLVRERILGTNDLVQFAPSTQAAEAAVPVARITTAPGKDFSPEGFGSGLLLPGGLLLTNCHVFPTASHAEGCAANFGHAREDQRLRTGIFFELDPGRFYVNDKTLDFAIVAVSAQSVEGRPLNDIRGTRLIEVTGKILTGMSVNIIQHPNGGPRRFAVSNNRLVDILPEGFIHYEADTDRGSSGSPVYNKDWELLALHHSGVPEMRDGKPWSINARPWVEGDPEEEINWIANEGTRVSSIVEFLKGAKMRTPAGQSILDELLATTRDPLEMTANESEAQSRQSVPPVQQVVQPRAAPSNLAASAGIQLTFTGAVTIHVSAPWPSGNPALDSGASVANTLTDATTRPASANSTANGALETSLERSLVFDPDYGSRAGYNEEFLGISVPLPTMTAERLAEVYTVGDYKLYFADYLDVPELAVGGKADGDPLVLKYHNYSLVHNKTYFMCMFTASNCDYRDESRADPRSRAAFGGENWRYDPRVPWNLQLGNDDVYGPAKRVDRGHIVRREDNCWGVPGLATEFANSDTYHWTNCTPQHEAFNQGSPTDKSGGSLYKGTGIKGIWGQFEGDLAEQIDANGGRASIFAGPVLANFFESIDWGKGKIPVPKNLDP